ncbi:MAG: glutamine--fructose-6-phosphate transaminase (isomerizing) [Parachlamydiales bacterium]|nr:glutamine--fructose-6-phosphate transaminase (isomerizing) [Parachlamydiales bacterium]
MCGIFGYVGKKQNPLLVSLEGLKKLEYRGYDSAGVAGVTSTGTIYCCKDEGKIAKLEKVMQATPYTSVTCAIAHTRWATHGRPSQNNAHPHFDGNETVAIVHNGIIENYRELRLLFPDQVFRSQTDTEVVAFLINQHYQGDLVDALRKAISHIKGAFALAVVHKAHPGEIAVVSVENPLSIGYGENEFFFGSDPHAFLSHTKKLIYLENGEIARITDDAVTIFSANGTAMEKVIQTIDADETEIDRGEYDHFMLKEIYEQPSAMRNSLLGRVDIDNNTVVLEDLTLSNEILKDIDHVQIVGCGSSWHAGCIGSNLFQELANVSSRCDIASELRYQKLVLPKKTLVIALSQSGETADTLAALRELKTQGYHIVSLSNNSTSTIARESDSCLLLKVGLEVGVASTKAYTGMLSVLYLLALKLAQIKETVGLETSAEFLYALKRLPQQIENVLQHRSQLQDLAKKYAHFEQFIFLGRNYMFPTCLEGALKLKEISYIHASGYPAGEMKHGPIALINEDCPTVALCANAHTYDKMLSNLMEVKSRNGLILAIAPEGSIDIEKVADDVFYLPNTLDCLAPVLSTVATQLFSYEIAKLRGTEIDQPRNLAKSVTVE